MNKLTIKSKPCGSYSTNCYIVTKDNQDIIIDPGVDATSWVSDNTTNPIAILNTHGHFDHVWSNAQIAKLYNIPIYCPKDDAFMLDSDPFEQGTPQSKANYLIDGDESIIIGSFNIRYFLHDGHTPGCSIIEIDDTIFSGDFIFRGSIGRFDFPYSDANKMRESIKKFMLRDKDMPIYCGHGKPTTVSQAQAMLPAWLEHIS